MAFPPLILVAISFLVPQPAKPGATARAVRGADAAAQKVWTNDDIPMLREMAPISIFSASANSEASFASTSGVVTAASRQPYVKELDPRWYAQQRDTLQARIDADQEQIREIQQIQQTGDGISDAIPLDKNAPGLTPYATVEILQNQIAQIESQIDDLQDLARRNGIPAVAVR
ncbi:MAG: hypothetical protein WAL95_02565 [Candidatus Acidiferrales bacterium]